MTGQLSLFADESGRREPVLSLDQDLEPIAIAKDIPDVRLPGLVPDTATFALTRGYPMRAVQVTRILALLSGLQPTELITRETLGQELGMTWAAAQSHLNVMRRMVLVEPKNRLSPFGRLVSVTAPHVDNEGLLWFLHYLVASDANLVLWSNLFNLVVQDRDSCTIQGASEFFGSLSGRWSEKSLTEKSRHEFGGILATYTDELLTPLRLVHKVDKGLYGFDWNAALIPPLVWLSCILAYRDRYYPGSASLEVPLIIHAHYSPGRILRQNQAAVRRALDELHNAGLLAVETRSGLDQVRFKHDGTWLKAIAAHLQAGPQR